MKLGIAVLVLVGAGVGVYFLVSRGQGGATPAATPAAGLPAAPGADTSRRSALSADDDKDGLANGDELAWGSDPLKADTDGDGYLDGEEVRAGHDPRIAGPNDKLDGDSGRPAAGPVSNQERLAALQRAPTIDPYLRDDISYEIGGGNLTEAYEKKVPEGQRSKAGRIDFALAQPIETALPRPGSLPAAQSTTPALLRQYLDVAEDYTVLADQAQFTSAQSALFLNANPGGFAVMQQRFASYQERLKHVPVPEAALPLQTLLLAYSQAQTDALAQVSEVYTADPVKARVAVRQAAAMDQYYFPLIMGEFTRLHELADTL
ncbi:MAG: hypothetical protein COU35_00620 [Candidatus Magasanikbacteria bacterium CG10_big_fil_rev_8_21_14_0_10_47_10]|uniref:EF-hand domain-containing protein n=1 Tax=Candidatus Magasanikbacteria bacterium CG10_big_fil_rev_8_21_14_0_10_47_10 TaxID=1974652 RepID=A0A2H0TTM7_9BACT|nr:MAG: hypothetical protein COU35_00620 [Candidatus Magasanikbacteria bacterium CG10_big_fil_rev_8_21_14_0_10_47_10]